MIPEKLTEHFTWDDVSRSTVGERHGVDNTPPESVKPAIIHTAQCMELVRTKILRPIMIDSWYRCLVLNALVNSKYTSQHIKGEAVDWICPKWGTPIDVVRLLIPFIEELQIDQIILEWSWIHTSFCSNPTSKPRGNVLTLLEDGNYAAGITDKQGKLLVGDTHHVR